MGPGVCESTASLSFDLDAVLTEHHPRWEPRKPGEQYTYRRLTLTFPSVRRVEWLDPGGPPAIDATGERDWENIDTFAADADTYELTGGWGHVASSPTRRRSKTSSSLLSRLAVWIRGVGDVRHGGDGPDRAAS